MSNQPVTRVEGEYQAMGQQVAQFGIERRGMSGDGARRLVTISTEKPVRSGGGIARADGAVLKHYEANPVVMWSHNYGSPPIAKCTSIVVHSGVGIDAEFEFPAEGIYPLADVVRGLWDGGFINAASIGFEPLKWNWVKDGGNGEYPVFETWELYEFSLVSIPRDREALRRAVELVGSYDLGEAAPINKALLLRGLKAWREVMR